jgi:hypothetical protein
MEVMIAPAASKSRRRVLTPSFYGSRNFFSNVEGKYKSSFPGEISMPRRALRLAAASLSLFIGCLPAYSQAAPQATPAETTVDDKENKAILELGAATSWNVTGGAATFAPNLAMEIEPIEHWLELEAGVSLFYTHNSEEWDTDLLFKKPWTLSRKAEFMFGIGPEWIHLKQGSGWSNALAGEIAGDFMFWPTGKHHFGWYLEPAYDYSFASGHQKSLGISFGLLIGLR